MSVSKDIHLMHNAVPVRDIICMLYVFVALRGWWEGNWFIFIARMTFKKERNTAKIDMRHQVGSLSTLGHFFVDTVSKAFIS